MNDMRKKIKVKQQKITVLKLNFKFNQEIKLLKILNFN